MKDVWCRIRRSQFPVEEGYNGASYSTEHQEQSRSSSLPATADLDGTFVTCDKPFETLPEKTSAEHSLSYKWTDNGNWGKLGEVMVFPIATSLAIKETCAVGGSSASGR